MKVTSTKKDLLIYSFITIVFAIASIVFLMRIKSTEIYYLLLMLLFLLVGIYFLICALRFRITWDENTICVRQGLQKERSYTMDQLQSVTLVDQAVLLILNGKKCGFSQGCPHTMEFLEFLEKQGKVKL